MGIETSENNPCLEGFSKKELSRFRKLRRDYQGGLYDFPRAQFVRWLYRNRQIGEFHRPPVRRLTKEDQSSPLPAYLTDRLIKTSLPEKAPLGPAEEMIGTSEEYYPWIYLAETYLSASNKALLFEEEQKQILEQFDSLFYRLRQAISADPRSERKKWKGPEQHEYQGIGREVVTIHPPSITVQQGQVVKRLISVELVRDPTQIRNILEIAALFTYNAGDQSITAFSHIRIYSDKGISISRGDLHQPGEEKRYQNYSLHPTSIHPDIFGSSSASQEIREAIREAKLLVELYLRESLTSVR